MTQKEIRYCRPGFFYDPEPVKILGEHKEAQAVYEAALSLIKAMNPRFNALKFQPDNEAKIKARNAAVLQELDKLQALLDQLRSQVE